MKKRSSTSFGLLAVLIAVLMVSITLCNAGAATIPDDEIAAIINTHTELAKKYVESANPDSLQQRALLAQLDELNIAVTWKGEE